MLLLGSGAHLDTWRAVPVRMNRPRLCPGRDEAGACLRLETWRALSLLFPCEGNTYFLFQLWFRLVSLSLLRKVAGNPGRGPGKRACRVCNCGGLRGLPAVRCPAIALRRRLVCCWGALSVVVSWLPPFRFRCSLLFVGVWRWRWLCCGVRTLACAVRSLADVSCLLQSAVQVPLAVHPGSNSPKYPASLRQLSSAESLLQRRPSRPTANT